MLSARMAAALVTAALLGLAAWFVFAWSTGAGMVVFRTGSMSPAMPQGSLAVTVPVAASELAVGDVVTVSRGADRLPVTHRVVEIRAPEPEGGTGSPQVREVWLKGDANGTADRHPYLIAEARRVVFALPFAGAALMTVQSPIGMGALLLLSAAAVTWAFWPRRRDGANR